MRPEKQFLVDEINSHLDKGDYVFLTNYERMTVPDIAKLREELNKHEAEFHVIKNRILNVAVTGRGLPDLSTYLEGQTAIVIGGKDAPAVAKTLLKFTKNTEKAAIKGGLLGKSAFRGEDAKAISEMPPLEVIQAKFLGVLKAPAQKTVNLFHEVPQRAVNVLAAPAQKILGVLNAYKFKMEQEGAA